MKDMETISLCAVKAASVFNRWKKADENVGYRSEAFVCFFCNLPESSYIFGVILSPRGTGMFPLPELPHAGNKSCCIDVV